MPDRRAPERSTDVIVGVAIAVVMVGAWVLNGAMSPGSGAVHATLPAHHHEAASTLQYTGRIARATAWVSGWPTSWRSSQTSSPADAIVLDRVHDPLDHVHAAYEGRPVLHGVNLTWFLASTWPS